MATQGPRKRIDISGHAFQRLHEIPIWRDYCEGFQQDRKRCLMPSIDLCLHHLNLVGALSLRESVKQ